MAGIKRKTSDEWEAGSSLKNRKTDGSEHGALLFTDLAEVLQLLRRYGYSGVSYYNLGLFLGLSPNTLDVIRTNNKDVESCLRECLTKWLQKADDVDKKGGPTIYSLISALRELKQKAAADGIDMEMHPGCKILAHYASNQSLVSALPLLAALLCLEKLIKEMMSTNVQGEALLIEIKEAVCNDYQKLQALAEILCKFKVTASIGNTIMKEYRDAYCIDDKVNDNTNAEELKIFLPKNVTLEFKMMRLNLGQTFFKVGSIMMSSPQSPTLDNIKYVLGAYDKTLRPQVAQCQDVRSILQLVSDSCQLDDISVLEFFVNEFNIEEAKEAIQKYKKAIEELKETKLSQCFNEMVSCASSLECEIITIVVDKDANESTLNDVERLSSAVFENSSRHVRLNVIRRYNSFTITCSFPLILSEQLITAALNNIDVLKKNKVKRLTIGYCTVYEVNDTSTPTKCGLMKQMMLSLNVQLINSTEENATIKKEVESLKKETESLKETLVIKNKMLSAACRAESDKFEKKAAETKRLQEKVSHLTEREEENEKLKEIKDLLEEQLVSFQSEKEEVMQLEKSLQEKIEEQNEELQLLKVQLASYQEEKEDKEESFAEEIKKLQSATDKDEREKIVQGLLLQNKKLKAQLAKYQKEKKILIEEADKTRQILEETKNELQSALKQKNEIINEKEKLAESEKVLKKKLLSLEKDMKTMKLENDQLQSEKEKVIALGKSKIRQLQENVKMSKRTVAYGGPHLTIADLALVDDLLTRHGFTTTNCFKLGLQLGLITNTLDVIETKWKGDASRCLLECLKQWLKLADDVKSKGGTTIPALIKALRKIGETATANGICNETHPACSILKQYISDQSVVEGLPQLALSLYKEGIIGTMMTPAGARGVEVLLTLIQESVCADHRNLEKFATILQQFSSTAAIGTLIRKDYIEKIFDDITQVHNKIEFQPIRATYAKAVTNARSAMIAIPSDDLKKFLCGGYPYLIPQLEHVVATDDILDVVCSRRCSIVNVSLLENVARYFKVEEAIIIIEEYRKSLQEFKPLRRFLDEELFSGSNLESEMISFIIDGNFDDYTLQDIQQLLQYAFKELAPHVMIKVIREHTSFIVICSFPLSLSEQLIATAEENIELLKNKGVKKLTIGYCTLYDNEEVSKVDIPGVQDEKFKPSIDQNDKLEQLMLSHNVQLINREQELIHQSEVHKQEIVNLQALVKELSSDEAHSKLEHMEKQYDTLLKKNEKLQEDLKKQRSDVHMRQSQGLKDPNPIVFQDDIYGEIVIDHPLIIKIVKTKQFQRLKDIKKLGYTYQNTV